MLQIGVLISGMLFGVTTAQAYIYYQRFPEDRFLVKTTVYCATRLCETVHVICAAHTLYSFTITDYGHPDRLLGQVPWSLPVVVLLTALIAVCVQAFFSFRIYALSKRLLMPCFTWALSFVRGLAGITIFVARLRAVTLSEYVANWKWLALTTWALSAADDITITTTLVYLLYKQRNHDHKRTTALVDKIILWTMETGLMTSTFSLVTLICFRTMESN
ncbi:hypothetical protein GGX14DRAFT_524974, partial [Mycena pura]